MNAIGVPRDKVTVAGRRVQGRVDSQEERPDNAALETDSRATLLAVVDVPPTALQGCARCNSRVQGGVGKHLAIAVPSMPRVHRRVSLVAGNVVSAGRRHSEHRPPAGSSIVEVAAIRCKNRVVAEQLGLSDDVRDCDR